MQQSQIRNSILKRVNSLKTVLNSEAKRLKLGDVNPSILNENEGGTSDRQIEEVYNILRILFIKLISFAM